MTALHTRPRRRRCSGRTSDAEQLRRHDVTLDEIGVAREWADRCRLAEKLGYDTIHVPDHLGLPAPFPALVRAADVTMRPRVGTFVLNAGFWNPSLLGREITTVDALTGGRLDERVAHSRAARRVIVIVRAASSSWRRRRADHADHGRGRGRRPGRPARGT